MNDANPQQPADGLRLLVIEDDPDQQELIAETLADHFGGRGEIALADTCAAAMDRAAGGAFDMVLLDVNLPDGNGLDVLASLRQRDPSVPVMMLTGEADTGTAREAIRRGAVDYVVKAGAYLATMPLTVEKNLAAGRRDREREIECETADREAKRLRDEAQKLSADLVDAERRAGTDAMTGCYNRRAFERVFAQHFAESYRTGGDLAFVMLDLDRFKQVNDTRGHAVGDELVKAAAKSIRGNLREMDVPCRYGGDEFILLLPQTDARAAAAVAERVRADYAAASLRLLADGEPRTMSIGVGSLQTARPTPASPEALMVAVDRALYRAKEAGRDRVCLCAA